jgi:hypothetical protein
MPDGRAAIGDGATFRVTFWSADWTPWRALAQIAARWPSLQVEVRPTYGVPWLTSTRTRRCHTPSRRKSPPGEDPPRPPSAGSAPVLSVDGFEGPLDWRLETVRARQIDLARLSIVALSAES